MTLNLAYCELFFFFSNEQRYRSNCHRLHTEYTVCVFNYLLSKLQCGKQSQNAYIRVYHAIICDAYDSSISQMQWEIMQINYVFLQSTHTNKHPQPHTYQLVAAGCSKSRFFLSDDVSCVVRHRTRVASAHNCFTRFSVPQSTQCCECSNVLCIYLSSCCSQHPSKWSQIYVQCDLANYNHAPTFRLSISMWSTLNHFKVLHACVCVYCIRICNRNGKLRIGWKRKGLQQLIVL